MGAGSRLGWGRRRRAVFLSLLLLLNKNQLVEQQQCFFAVVVLLTRSCCLAKNKTNNNYCFERTLILRKNAGRGKILEVARLKKYSFHSIATLF
jgi:hypothetical protein